MCQCMGMCVCIFMCVPHPSSVPPCLLAALLRQPSPGLPAGPQGPSSAPPWGLPEPPLSPYTHLAFTVASDGSIWLCFLPDLRASLLVGQLDQQELLLSQFQGPEVHSWGGPWNP